MIIEQICSNNSLRNFSYLVGSNHNFYCIDPVNVTAIMEKLGSMNGKLVAVINTHSHHDHIEGNQELVKLTGCQVWTHLKAKGSIPVINRYLTDGEVIEIDENISFKVLYTPGHTFDHISILLRNSNNDEAIFTGDTLFNAGVGNCYSGDVEILYESLKKYYFVLGDQVRVYPGHDYMETNLEFTLSIEKDNQLAKELEEELKAGSGQGTIVTDMGMERKINVFLSVSGNSEKEDFIKYRELRNKW